MFGITDLKSTALQAGLASGIPVAAVAADHGSGWSEESFEGLLLLLVYVALAYAVVFLLKVLAGSKDLGPDKMHGADFDEFTRSIDDPTWKAPDSWPRRR